MIVMIAEPVTSTTVVWTKAAAASSKCNTAFS